MPTKTANGHEILRVLIRPGKTAHAPMIIRRETEKAYLLEGNAGRTAWFPKSVFSPAEGPKRDLCGREMPKDLPGRFVSIAGWFRRRLSREQYECLYL